MQWLRKRNGISICELAKKAGYDRKYITPLEYGEHDIKLQSVVKIARALDINLPLIFSPNLEEVLQASSKASLHFIEDDYLLVYIENINRFIKANNRHQYSLSCSSSIDAAAINRLLSGKTKNPRLSTLYRISLGTDIEFPRLFTRNLFTQINKGENENDF